MACPPGWKEPSSVRPFLPIYLHLTSLSPPALAVLHPDTFHPVHSQTRLHIKPSADPIPMVVTGPSPCCVSMAKQGRFALDTRGLCLRHLDAGGAVKDIRKHALYLKPVCVDYRYKQRFKTGYPDVQDRQALVVAIVPCPPLKCNRPSSNKSLQLPTSLFHCS